MLEFLNIRSFRSEKLSLIFAMYYRWFENALETKWMKTAFFLVIRRP
jgi:hypothetical protein